MKSGKIILAGLVGLVLAGVVAVKTGFAHQLFFELFAFVKGDGLVAPTVYRIPPQDSPYQRWLQTAGQEIPLFEGTVLHDIENVALQPWPQQGEGISGLYLRFSDYQMTDGRLLEIPAGASTFSQKHFYEKAIYILGGSGYTTLQQEDKPPRRIEWQQDDLFSIPLNVRHQHHGAGNQPARILAVTSFPMVINLLNSEDFINSSEHVFSDRYDGADDFRHQYQELGAARRAVNFAANVSTTPTVPNTGNGNARFFLHWVMAGNSMLNMHVSELPPRSRLNAHRHSSDAFILILAGNGFSLTWPEARWDDRIRVDWQAGTLFVPPTYWYHQHLNSGSEPARHLAINVPDVVKNLGLNFNNELNVHLDQVDEEWHNALEQADASH